MIKRITVSPEIVIDIFGGTDPHVVMVVNDKVGGRLTRIDPEVLEPLIKALERGRYYLVVRLP